MSLFEGTYRYVYRGVRMALSLTIMLIMVSVLFRAFIQFVRTGDSGIRTLKQSSSFELKLATILLYSVLFGILMVGFLSAKGTIEAQFQLSSVDYEIGLIICCVSLVLIFIAQLQMGKWWRIGVDEEEKTDLVISGIYAYIRNPIYSGVLIFAVGLVFMVMHWFSILMFISGYLSIDYLVKKVEEPYLVKLHGQDYLKYKQDTWSYLPFF